MKNNTIYEFDPQIYPTRLWVAINPTFEKFSQIFYGLSYEMEKIIVKEDDYGSKNSFKIATTCLVSDKKDGWIGSLVCIWKPKQFDIKTICHESAHCADFICDQFGISRGGFNDGEAYAYLVGWAAKCINQVRLGIKDSTFNTL